MGCGGACVFLSAQEVVSVEFRQNADYQFGEDVLLYNVQTRKGNVYSERIVNDDVKRLHAMGVFSDVVSITEEMPDGKKKVIFQITPKPVVSEIVYEGNQKYPEKKIAENVTVALDAPLNDKLLSISAENIRKFYADEGLNDAVVSVDIQKIDESHIRIVFHITENLRVRVNGVNFEGATVYTPSELRDAIATRYSFLSHSWLSWLPIQGGGLLDREELERDLVRLREYYWRKGYLDFQVKETRLEEVPGDPERVNVTFVLEEGEPYTVGQVRVNGGKRFSEEELLAVTELKPGMTYNVLLEEGDLASLEQKYSPLGYADFRGNALKHPDYRTKTVDLDYNIYEGPLYRIRDIFISGNKITKDHVIRRELPMLPMDPVDKNMLQVAKNRLMGMGYFEDAEDGGVEITARNSSDAPDMKDIDIKVRERRFIDFRIGAGISDTDSFAGMVELSHSNMDILDPWNYFSGGGQRMRIAALIGIEHMDIQADFTEPWLFGIPLRLDISGYWREVVFKYWDEQRIGFTVGLTKRIFDDFTTISGGYTFEQVGVLDMDKHRSEIFQKEKGRDLVGRLHLSIGRDTRDSATDPTSGYDISAYGAISSQIFGGSKNYYKVELKGINYLPFLNNWFVLSTGFKVGSVGMITDRDEMVPIYDRYFLGGGDSVRGFPYRSIGPVDRDEKNYGGQFMYLLTAELSHPIYSIVRGAFFVDVGDVTRSNFGPINKPNIGIGYGLRIKIPRVDVPLRLDLAYPVLCNQEDVKRKLRFHFNFGFSF